MTVSRRGPAPSLSAPPIPSATRWDREPSPVPKVRGVLEGLSELGRRAPDDIAIVGFDNWEIIATNTRPPLTTVDLQLEELGRTAAEKLFAAIEGTATGGTTALPCRLVVRESSVPS